MPKAYSGELRQRVIEAVAFGRPVARPRSLFAISVSTAVKWLQRWREAGSSAPKPHISAGAACGVDVGPC